MKSTSDDEEDEWRNLSAKGNPAAPPKGSDIGQPCPLRPSAAPGSMNGLPSPPSARPRSSGGSISNISGAPFTTSPKSTKGKVRTPKRRHDQTDPGSSSAESAEETAYGRKRQPGVKRACNECRQQKVTQTGLVLLRSWY